MIKPEENNMDTTAYEACKLFWALRQHFTNEKYDYFKYNGSFKLNKETFDNRKDKFLFAKLARMKNSDELRDYIISNMIANKVWLRDLLEDEAEDTYMEYKKRKEALTYTFQNEVDRLFSSVQDIRDLFRVSSGQYPKVLVEYMQGNISLETLSILDQFIQFSKVFDKRIGGDDVIWSKIRLTMSKLHPFLQYDRSKFSKILRQKMEEHNAGFPREE